MDVDVTMGAMVPRYTRNQDDQEVVEVPARKIRTRKEEAEDSAIAKDYAQFLLFRRWQQTERHEEGEIPTPTNTCGGSKRATPRE